MNALEKVDFLSHMTEVVEALDGIHESVERTDTAMSNTKGVALLAATLRAGAQLHGAHAIADAMLEAAEIQARGLERLADRLAPSIESLAELISLALDE